MLTGRDQLAAKVLSEHLQRWPLYEAPREDSERR
jgi:hypothetical protein